MIQNVTLLHLKTILGLDPAGPLWTLNSKRLRKTDAAYVEAIHTNGGFFGTLSPLGLVDFYPNGGVNQPGCITNVCNHMRSWELFAASVTYNHLTGHKCTSSLQFSVNICRGSTLKMGNGELSKIGYVVYAYFFTLTCESGTRGVTRQAYMIPLSSNVKEVKYRQKDTVKIPPTFC